MNCWLWYAVGRHHGNTRIAECPHRQKNHLKGIGWGDCGEALAVVSSLSQLGQPKVSIVDGEHNAGLPQAVVVVVAPEGPACRKSDR